MPSIDFSKRSLISLLKQFLLYIIVGEIGLGQLVPVALELDLKCPCGIQAFSYSVSHF
jgi:hypothetical protein